MIKIPCPSIRHLIPTTGITGICLYCNDIGYAYVIPAYPRDINGSDDEG